MKNKILLVYPNMPLSYLIPTNIGILSACLKRAGFEVKVFDTTFYKTEEKCEMEKRIEYGHYKPSKHIQYKTTNVHEDFQKLIDWYGPDVIGVSTVDATFDFGLELIKKAKHKAHVIFGGIYPTFNPDEVLSHKEINSICIGEGEEALVDLCNAIKNKKPIYDIKNIKTKFYSNLDIRPYNDINTLPREDFTEFPKENFYRPMQGKLKKMIPLMIDKGCPYNCQFCAEPMIRKLYGSGRSCNVKTMDNIKSYTKYMVEKYDPDYIYFNTETFFARSEEHIKEFADFYSREIGIPFCCMTRFDTMTIDRIKMLKDMNCNRISFGLEHGNMQFRNNILKKNIQDGDVFKAVNMTNKYSIGISVFCIIGFPDETEKLIWDTIDMCKLIKQIHNDVSFSASIFQPYTSSPLRQYCIDKKYIKPDQKTGGLVSESILDMPQLSKERINWFMRYFIELIG